MLDKHLIDTEAERQGIALNKMYKCTKDKRVRLEISNYNNEQFDKLFEKGK